MNYPTHPNLYFAVLILFNVFWLWTYILITRRGMIDRTWGVPMVSLSLNLAWDFAGSFLVPSPMGQQLMNILFLMCNIIITAQMLMTWRDDHILKAKVFYAGWMLMQLFALGIIIVGSKEMNDPNLVEIGFVDNFINSAFFIGMLYARPGLKGQSIYIALNKLIGTAAISLSWYIYPWPHTTPTTMIFLTFGIFLLDVIYVVLVWKRAQMMPETGTAAWLRFDLLPC